MAPADAQPQQGLPAGQDPLSPGVSSARSRPNSDSQVPTVASTSGATQTPGVSPADASELHSGPSDRARKSAAQRREHISTACEPCRSAKRKCSGGQPCAACTQRDLRCTYANKEDGRKKLERKRMLELEEDSLLLNDLLETVHGSRDKQVAQIVALIRSNPSLEEIKMCIKHQLVASRARREPSPELELLRDRIEEFQNPRRVQSDNHRLKIARLTDDPPFKVLAKPWTTVTEDDGLVSHLVSLYLTWDKPFYNFIDEALFIRDMQAGKPDAVYCTPFLVNAMLGYACTFSDYDEVKVRHGVFSDVQRRFIEEAERLWNNDSGAPLITVAQGLVMMVFAEGASGNDRSAFQKYGVKSVELCQELEQMYAPLELSKKKTAVELSRAVGVTCWGIFNWVNLAAYVYKRAPAMEPPKRSMPELRADPYEWTPYPQDGETEPSCYSCDLSHYRSKLTLIVYDICIYQSDGPLQRSQRPERSQYTGSSLYERLSQWRASLPEHLQVSEDAAPPVLIHHLYYLSLVISLAANANEDDDEDWADRAPALRVAAALEVAQIFQIYTNAFGNNYATIFVNQPLLLSLYTFIGEDDLFVYRTQITELCIFFRARSRKMPWTLAAFRKLHALAEEKGKVLPPETEQLFADFYSNDRQIAR